MLRPRSMVDEFMDCFIAALALKNKRAIWYKGENLSREHEKMRRVHEYLTRLLDPVAQVAKELEFVGELRDSTAPGNDGNFAGFYRLFRERRKSVKAPDPSHDYYEISLSPRDAARRLKRTKDLPRGVAIEAAKRYTEDGI